MPLLKEDLKKRFVKVFEDVASDSMKLPSLPTGVVPPLMQEKVADAFASAYHDWVMEGVPLAGGMTIASPGDKSVISKQLQIVPLMMGWASGTALYWTMVTWALPGIATGVTMGATMAKVAADLTLSIFTPPIPNPLNPQTKDSIAEKLASVLYDNTKMIQISMTTIALGATSVVTMV